tara:strand:+ start:2167 stop:3009 length:843 start_codon:yes stop_codon:yes gene_type:complete
MIYFFNGCSHTEGAQIPPTQTWANMVLQSISLGAKFYHIRSIHGDTDVHLFQALTDIKKQISFKEPIGISVAQSGKGNAAICFETINYIEYLKQIKQKPECVFIQWSGPSRTFIQTPEDQVQFITPYNVNSKLGKDVILEPLASSLTLTYYIILQNYLENNNIKYVFIDYMGIEDDVFNSYLKKSIKYDKVVYGKDDTLIDIFKVKHLNIDEQGHPNEKGFYYLASKILDKLNITTIPYHTWIDNLQYDDVIKLNKYFRVQVSSSEKLLGVTPGSIRKLL